MEVDAHAVAHAHVVECVTQGVVEGSIDRGNFGDDAYRARH